MQPVHRPLVFALNGERVELRNVDPATTLLHYIRSETRFKGPKRSCGEGIVCAFHYHQGCHIHWVYLFARKAHMLRGRVHRELNLRKDLMAAIIICGSV